MGMFRVTSEILGRSLCMTRSCQNFEKWETRTWVSISDFQLNFYLKDISSVQNPFEQCVFEFQKLEQVCMSLLQVLGPLDPKIK